MKVKVTTTDCRIHTVECESYKCNSKYKIGIYTYPARYEFYNNGEVVAIYAADSVIAVENVGG